VIWGLEIAGNVAAVTTSDGLCLFDLPTGRQMRRLDFPANRYYSAAMLCAQSRLLAALERGVSAADQSAHVCVWDVTTGKPLRRFEAMSPVRDLALSQDGQVLAGIGTLERSEVSVQLWDLETGRRRKVLRVQATGLVSAALSPDGKMLATWTGTQYRDPTGANVTSERDVQLWDVAGGRKSATIQTADTGVANVTFAPDGKTLALAGGRGTVQVFELATRKQRLQIDGPAGNAPKNTKAEHDMDDDDWLSRRCVVTYSHDGKTLASGTPGGGIDVTDTTTWKRLAHLPAPPWKWFSLAATGFRILAFQALHSSVHLWDVSAGKELTSAEGHNGAICSVAFAADDRIVSSGFDGDLCVWDATTAAMLHRSNLLRREDYVRSPDDFEIPLPVAPDGRHVVRIAELSPQRALDVASGKVIGELQAYSSFPCWLLGVAFSADGQTAALGPLRVHRHEDEVCVWDLKTGAVTATVGSFPCISDAPPLGVAVSRDPIRLAVLARRTDPGNINQQITELSTFEVASRQRLCQVPVPISEFNELSLSADGETIALVEGDGTVVARRAATGEIIRTFAGRSSGYPTKLLFSPDGRTLAIASVHDKDAAAKIALIETASGHVRTEFEGHAGTITCLGWSHDGRKLVSGGVDTTALIWDLPGQRGDGKVAHDISSSDLEKLWIALASTDARQAYGALWQLRFAPRESIGLLRTKLRPVSKKVPGPEQLERMVRSLDDTRFEVREEATRGLHEAGKAAQPVLGKALAARPSPEKRQRIERLLAMLDGHTLDRQELREVRAIEVLESIALPEARQLLQTIADGRDDASVTRQARASLRRLAARTVR
jgi:WD40 repeat protein